MTGPQALAYLKRQTTGLPIGKEIKIDTSLKYDLAKLKVSELVADGFSEKRADEVVAAFSRGGGIAELSESLGLKLIIG